MRIVGGESRGRILLSVEGNTTRPTADRIRQSLFDLLGQRMDGMAILDLYAGTGALAFEALSRGALRATLIEKDMKAFKVIELNAAALKYAARCKPLRDEVDRALPKLRGEQFDLVFSDPPYALLAAQRTLDALAAADLLAPGGRVVLEMGADEPNPACPPGLTLIDEREYGDTRVVVVERRLATPTLNGDTL